MRLSAPTIDLVLPPIVNGTINIPFELNPVVNPDLVNGYRVRFSSATSNDGTVDRYTEINNNISVNDNHTLLTITDIVSLNLKPKQFYHFQIACMNENDVGEWSTAGLTKYCVIPDVTLNVTPNNLTLTGIYTTSDLLEPIYEYRFYITDENDNIFIDSGKLLNDSSKNTINLPVLNEPPVLTITNTYVINKTYIENSVTYTAHYEYWTVNGLYGNVEQSYNVSNIVPPDMTATLEVEQDRENGCNIITMKTNEVRSGQYQLLRANGKDNYTSWDVLKTYNVLRSIDHVAYTDWSIEQGESYKYAYRQSDNAGHVSNLAGMVEVDMCDFEYIFLGDKDKQLKICFNPEVSSFKETVLESKQDTLGSKYPYFFRNGDVSYKEFPISGLISYLMDPNEIYIDKEKLGLEKFSGQRNHTNSQKYGEFKIPTTNQVDYNFYAERKFKLDVLAWLNNGLPKLFRSPSEGNYVVRLMNVNLSPENGLSRMIHKFSATAYEFCDGDLKSMIAAGCLQDADVVNEEGVETTSVVVANAKHLGENEYEIVNSNIIEKFSMIRVDNVHPQAKIILKEDGVMVGEYTIGQTGSLDATNLPAANSISIITAIPFGTVTYIATYSSTSVGEDEITFSNIENITTSNEIISITNFNTPITLNSYVYNLYIDPGVIPGSEAPVIKINGEEISIIKVETYRDLYISTIEPISNTDNMTIHIQYRLVTVTK